jgi:hypothetical protein
MTTRKRLSDLQTAERRAKLMALVIDGRYSWEQIADKLGYASRGAACTDYKRAWEDRLNEATLTTDEFRRQHLANLMETRRVAVEVMRRDHVHVSAGKIVREELGVHAGPDGPEYELGAPLMDDGPTLAAIDRVAKIDAQIAQLLGLNAPTRVEAEGSLTVTVVGVDPAELT